MYKIVMISAFVVLGIGWAAYWIYEWRLRLEEKRTPRRKRATTEHLEKVRNSFDEYTKQMEKFELKAYDKKEEEKK